MTRQLVDDWIQYHASDSSPNDRQNTAWDRVHTLVHDEPEIAWPLILKLVRLSPNDWVLASVAAGPLEDLLTKQDELFLDRVEAEAANNPRFCRCLTGVWGLSKSMQARLAIHLASVTNGYRPFSPCLPRRHHFTSKMDGKLAG